MVLRPLRINDLALVKSWLGKNHIQHYFGNPESWLEEITENRMADWINYFIAEADIPIGFAQYYETNNAPSGIWSDEPLDTVGIDFFIGEEKYLNTGLGSELVQHLVSKIKAKEKYDYIIADPDTHNNASIKVLEKNDFVMKPNGLYQLRITKSDLVIKRASQSNLAEITQLFYNTIQNINSKDYPQDEIDDWSSWYSDTERWSSKIAEQFFIIALLNERIVGFSSLTTNGYLDFMFVHNHYQRKGIARQLLQKIEKKAIEQNNAILHSEVSITARIFFEHHGFRVEKQQAKKSKEKELINFRMSKQLG